MTLDLQPSAPGRGLVSPSDPGEPSTGKPRISITEDEAQLLAALAFNRKVLEIGTGLGVSTRAMADTAAFIRTIDIDPWVHDNVWPYLRGDNVWTTRDRVPTGIRYDMAFIDGDHTPSAFLVDVEFCLGMVRSGGILVAHDAIELADHIDQSWWRIPTTYGLALTLVP